MGNADDADATTTRGGSSIVIHADGQALHVSGGVSEQLVGVMLTGEQLAPVVEQAIVHWSLAGASAAQVSLLQQRQVQLADLSGELVEFLTGERELPSGLIDRLAALLRYELVPAE